MRPATLRGSTLRVAAGGILALLGVGVGFLLLPRASRKLEDSRKAAAQAGTSLARAQGELAAAQEESLRLRQNRATLDRLLANLPHEPVGQLTWRLSQELFTQAATHGVRLVAVKYGGPAHEGTRGMPLESVDVEFTALGLYADLKAFMLGLEKGRLPFAVVSAKLDENPEGAQLAIALRAFRQAAADGEHR